MATTMIPYPSEASSVPLMSDATATTTTTDTYSQPPSLCAGSPTPEVMKESSCHLQCTVRSYFYLDILTTPIESRREEIIEGKKGDLIHFTTTRWCCIDLKGREETHSIEIAISNYLLRRPSASKIQLSLRNTSASESNYPLRLPLLPF